MALRLLEQILPIYCKVLLQDDYKDYLAEIIIDGYTDTDGDYSYNLQLSQQRSLAVAQYLIDIQGNFLNDEQSQELEKYLTVNGHSMANPVLDADGKPITETVEVMRPAFKVVSVFDISQTDGKELPDIIVDELSGSVENYAAFFEALKQESPVPISFEDIPGGAKGYFSPIENRIAIQEGMSEKVGGQAS